METIIAAVVTAIAGLLTKLGVDSRPTRTRKGIGETLALLAKAQEVSAPDDVVASLENALKHQASQLSTVEKKANERRLDWGGFSVGIFFTAAVAIGAWALFAQTDGWYTLPAAIILGLLALVLLAASISALGAAPREKSTGA